MCHVCVHENNITLIAESNVHAHLKQRVQLLVGPKAMFDTTRPIARRVHLLDHLVQPMFSLLSIYDSLINTIHTTGVYYAV